MSRMTDEGMKPVDAEQCARCANRKPDHVKNGRVLVNGASSAYCLVYTPEIGAKPYGVLQGTEKCEYRAEE